MTTKYRIEVLRKPATRTRWFWRIIAKRNGKTLAHSESYSSKRAALATAHAIGRDWGVTVEVLN